MKEIQRVQRKVREERDQKRSFKKNYNRHQGQKFQRGEEKKGENKLHDRKTKETHGKNLQRKKSLEVKTSGLPGERDRY